MRHNKAKESKPLVLVGFMACGKTTIGALLAQRLDVPFVDTDAELETKFSMKIAEIFRSQGESAFRDAERRIIVEMLEGEFGVMAVGGGAFVDSSTRAKLAGAAVTVWLDPPFETIKLRLEQSADRPLAAQRSAAELHQLWSERRSAYAKADVHISNSQRDLSRTVEEIVERVSAS